GRFLDVVSAKSTRPRPDAFASRFSIDQNAAICEAYRSGQPVWIPTRERWERRFPDGLGPSKPWARSILAVPLLIGDQRMGAIGLMFRTEGRLSRDERRLAKTFGEQAALALERARLFEHEHAARQTTERLRSFASAMAAVATTEDVLSIVVDEGRQLVDAEAAWAALLDPGTQELHAAVSRGYDPQTMERFDRLPPAAPVPAWDAARGRRGLGF